MNTQKTDQGQVKIALFDFDDTISRGDSIVAFLHYCIRRHIAPRRQWIHALRALWHYLFPFSAMPQPKEAALSFIRGKTTAEMSAVARDFLHDVLEARMKPDALAEMKALKKQGYTILIVSASASVYMEALRSLPMVDDVLSTLCCVENGMYTGKMGPNCRQEEKPRRIRSWLEEQGITHGVVLDTAYGDSRHDIPMFRMVTHPVLVSPKKKLKALFPGARVVTW